MRCLSASPTIGFRQTDRVSITHLDPVLPLVEPPVMAGGDHPMRKVTRQVAFDGGWDPARAEKVAALFDGMASEWDQPRRAADERWSALRDALNRGDIPRGRVLELGSGTGPSLKRFMIPFSVCRSAR